MFNMDLHTELIVTYMLMNVSVQYQVLVCLYPALRVRVWEL